MTGVFHDLTTHDLTTHDLTTYCLNDFIWSSQNIVKLPILERSDTSHGERSEDTDFSSNVGNEEELRPIEADMCDITSLNRADNGSIYIKLDRSEEFSLLFYKNNDLQCYRVDMDSDLHEKLVALWENDNYDDQAVLKLHRSICFLAFWDGVEAWTKFFATLPSAVTISLFLMLMIAACSGAMIPPIMLTYLLIGGASTFAAAIVGAVVGVVCNWHIRKQPPATPDQSSAQVLHGQSLLAPRHPTLDAGSRRNSHS